MTDRNPDFETDGVPEPVAQRIIARAIEIDGDGASRMPIARLREVAAEAGISPHALERAIVESLTEAPLPVRATVPDTGVFARLKHRLVNGVGAGRTAPEPDLWSVRGVGEALLTNVIAFVGFWIPSLLALSFLHNLGIFRSGPLDIASILFCTLLGIALAWRLRARVTALFLSVCSVGIAVNLVIDLLAAGRHGGFLASTAFGWLLAGVLGVGLGILLARLMARSAGPARANGAQAALPSLRAEPGSTAREETGHFLRLRLHGV